MFGISGPELIVLLVVAVLVSGPKGVAQAYRALRKGLALFQTWSARLRQRSDLSALAAELGVDPGKLDLSQYDPRALVRQAVREEMDAWTRSAGASGGTGKAGGPETSNKESGN